jgi:hypothetical protein
MRLCQISYYIRRSFSCFNHSIFDKSRYIPLGFWSALRLWLSLWALPRGGRAFFQTGFPITPVLLFPLPSSASSGPEDRKSR